MAVRLKDVAELANVSPTVVSHVLHNKASTVRVSLATAERVKTAAAQLGYRVNIMARNFRDRQTKTIGVLNGRGLSRPSFDKGPRYFASLMDGIVDGSFERGFSVTLCPQLLGEHPEQGISDGRFDGLIWYSIEPSEENLAVLDACLIPIVIVHAHAEDFQNRFPTVIANNMQGLGLAIDHLADLGHSRIAFAIEGDAMNVESMERLAGYRYHMARSSLRFDERDILDISKSRMELDRYLHRSELPHSAVIVHADGLASEFILRAQEYGHQIPEELAIVGFDSTDFCDEIRPTLTSISQPLFDLGRTAARQLMKLIAGEEVAPLESLLPCGLDVRGSTLPS